MSDKQKEYLKNEKKHKIFILSIQILIFIIFISSWQILSSFNIIDSFIFSSPYNICKTIIDLYKNNNLFIHIWTTIKETLIAFSLTSILSTVISIILYYFNTLAKIVNPYLTIFNSLPKVALGPILIIWLGANTNSIITMAILISIIISIQNIYIGFINTDKLKIKLMKTFNASKIQILKEVVLKENKNVILNTLKINISMCLIGLLPPVRENPIF